MSWSRADFAERVGLGTSRRIAFSGTERPVLIGKADVDPVTRGMMAAVSGATLDGAGGASDISLIYWYRRQNGQSNSVHLLEVKTELQGDEIAVEEIFYRNKPLLSTLAPEQRQAAQEMLLDAIREINLHLREGGSPKEILKILYDKSINDVIGEDITLPGQNQSGQFKFRISDTFNPAAHGKLTIPAEHNLPDLITSGEINTLDSHRRIEGGERSTFGTTNVGTTFRADFNSDKTAGRVESGVDLVPAMIPDGEKAFGVKDFFKVVWKVGRTRNENIVSFNERAMTLQSMKFMGIELKTEDVDTQIRVLGMKNKIMDMMRRRRYPTALDFVNEFGLLDLVSPTEPPPPEGRFSVMSLLGNGKEETIGGFGFDLGACKLVISEWWEKDELKREVICLDVGKLLPPKGSDKDGGLPNLNPFIKDINAFLITHRHLDHMAALIELTRLGLLKGKIIYGAPRTLYILEQQVKAELDDKTLMPQFRPIKSEGIMHFKRASVEHCVDAVDHSTPSTIYRVLGRKNDKAENLSEDDVWGSYLFYGDGRDVSKPEFLERGMRSFGIERQDTLFEMDITNAKKPGLNATEEEALKNKEEFFSLFSDLGIIKANISTNDRRLKSDYRMCNRLGRNFTAVGHNMEMSIRAHNIHGVDPEYNKVHDKDNVNNFLLEDAKEETQKRTGHLKERLEHESDPGIVAEIEGEIEDLRLKPVEYRSRGSDKAKGWLNADLGKLLVLVTGTQGNLAEMYSTLNRFAEGWSTLDADRHTAYKIKQTQKWLVHIDQSAIPGNEKEQRELIRKLLTNRYIAGVVVDIDDGFKCYGFKPELQQQIVENYVHDGRSSYVENDGSLVVTGAPFHPSGHGYKRNIEKIARSARADINHGTHSNDPENVRAFHHDICEPSGLRHTGRQFDDFERNGIDMRGSAAEARVESLGHENRSIILYNTIREFGKFHGGTLQASIITKLDGRTGYAGRGLMAGSRNTEFEADVLAVDFNEATHCDNDNKRKPPPSVSAPPWEERRSKGVTMPQGVRIDERKRKMIREISLQKVA